LVVMHMCVLRTLNMQFSVLFGGCLGSNSGPCEKFFHWLKMNSAPPLSDSINGIVKTFENVL
jgi:hypothetical protein